MFLVLYKFQGVYPTEPPLSGCVIYLLFALQLHCPTFSTLLFGRLLCMDINELPCPLAFGWVWWIYHQRRSERGRKLSRIFIFVTLTTIPPWATLALQQVPTFLKVVNCTRLSPSKLWEPLALVTVLFSVVLYIYTFISNLFINNPLSKYSILSNVLFLIGTLTDTIPIQEPARKIQLLDWEPIISFLNFLDTAISFSSLLPWN